MNVVSSKLTLLLILFVVATSGLYAQQGSDIRVLKTQSGDSHPRIDYCVANTSRHATYAFSTELLGITNIASNVSFPFKTNIPPASTNLIFSLYPETPKKWAYSLTNAWAMGDILARHDDTIAYQLPFGSSAVPIELTHGYGDLQFHTGAQEFALDFAMPVNTPVFAARRGRVVAVKEDSDVGGADKKFIGTANYVLIQHADGTLAEYVHLKKNGAAVTPGQAVSTGDLLGFSGNTGYSTGSHLHFRVYKPTSGNQFVSFPTQFRILDGTIGYLKEGQRF